MSQELILGIVIGAVVAWLITRLRSGSGERADQTPPMPVRPAGPLPDPGNMPPGVMDALARGQMIEAIKCYRQATGAGLREAKDAVEAARRRGGT